MPQTTIEIDLRVLFQGIGQPTPEAGTIISVEAVDARGSHVKVDGSDVTFHGIDSAPVDASATSRLAIPVTDGTFCIRWNIRTPRGHRLERFTLIPVSDEVVAFGDLQQVDPKTFEPTTDVVAAWAGVAREATAARDVALSASSTAVAAAEGVQAGVDAVAEQVEIVEAQVTVVTEAAAGSVAARDAAVGAVGLVSGVLTVSRAYEGLVLEVRGNSWVQFGGDYSRPFVELLPDKLGFLDELRERGRAGRAAQDNAWVMVAASDPGVFKVTDSGVLLLSDMGNNLMFDDTAANRSAGYESMRTMVALGSASAIIQDTGWTFLPNTSGETWSESSAQPYASGGSLRVGVYGGLKIVIPVPAGTSYLLCHAPAISVARGMTLRISQNGVEIAVKSLDGITVATGQEAKQTSPVVIRLANLEAGTITVTTDKAGIQGDAYAFVDALLPQAANPRPIIVVKPVRVTAPSHDKPVLLGYYRGVPELLVQEFGSHVLVADPDPGWNPVTMLGPDGLHPLPIGAEHVAASVAADVRDAVWAIATQLALAAAGPAPLNALSVDALIAALDMRDPREVVIGQVGDSTADFSDEWFETAMRELFASIWPDRPARLKRWNRTEDQYPAAFTTWQSAETPGTPSNPGGTFPNTVIASDGFARTAALVGSSMDIGSSAYTGTAGVLSTDGDRIVTNASNTAVAVAGMRAREGADFSAGATFRITSKAAANRQGKFYAVRKDTSNDLELAYAGSTVITVTVVKRIAGVATVLGTFPAGTIPSNSDPADYRFEMALAGTTLTSKVNGATLMHTLTADDVIAVAGMTNVGISAPAEPTFSVDLLEVRGTVVVPPSGGTAPVPSTLGWATVYNGSIAGSTIESQRTRLPRIMPQRPDLIVITHGHNYGASTAASFIASIDGFLAELAAVHGDGIPVAVMSENPRFTADMNEVAHRRRQTALRAAARERGWLYFPGFEAYARLVDGGRSYVSAADGVHPYPVGTTPSGARLQAEAAKSVIFELSERLA